MSSSSISPASSKQSTRWLWFVIALAVIGAGLSIELTRVHVLLYTDDSFVAGCDVNETINCSKVELSPQAILLGVPLSVWGLLGYLVVLGVAFSGLRRRGDSWPRGTLAGMGLLYTCMSVYNAYVSLVILDAICPFCVGTYLVNLLLLILALVVVLRSGTGLGATLHSDVSFLLAHKPASLSAIATFVLAAGLLMAVYPRYWETHSAENDHAIELATGHTSDGDHWIGATNPAVTIIEFSDYECPFCARSNVVVRDIVRARKDELRLIHRHYPLDVDCNDELDRPFHRHSCQAARAALCAGLQNRFWQMNDALFANQQKLKASLYAELATELKLDTQRFAQCMKARSVDSTIKRHVAMGAKLGAHGTPFYLVNGTLHMGALTPQKLEELIAKSSFAAGPGASEDSGAAH